MDPFQLSKFFNEHDLWPKGLTPLMTGQKTAIFQYVPHPQKGAVMFDTQTPNQMESLYGVALRGLLDHLKDSSYMRKILMSYKNGTDFLEHIVTKYQEIFDEAENKLAKSDKPEILVESKEGA